jgi:hypothetical protein
VGQSGCVDVQLARVREDQPTHLVVRVADRDVRACSGTEPPSQRLTVAFDEVYAGLSCGRCRAFWRHVLKVPRS